MGSVIQWRLYHQHKAARKKLQKSRDNLLGSIAPRVVGEYGLIDTSSYCGGVPMLPIENDLIKSPNYPVMASIILPCHITCRGTIHGGARSLDICVFPFRIGDTVVRSRAAGATNEAVAQERVYIYNRPRHVQLSIPDRLTV